MNVGPSGIETIDADPSILILRTWICGRGRFPVFHPKHGVKQIRHSCHILSTATLWLDRVDIDMLHVEHVVDGYSFGFIDRWTHVSSSLLLISNEQKQVHSSYRLRTKKTMVKNL